jgi:uncharacterized protein (TIGR03086 family)
MTTELLEQSFATARGVLANVKPDQLDDDTPCQSWKVRDVVNHMVGGSQWFGATMNSGESDNPGDSPDLTTQDYMAIYDDGMAKSIDAFGKPGAQEKIVKLPFGEFPGAAFMGLATTDQFTHAWDLAKATGQDTNLNPALAEQLLVGAKASISPQFRGDEPMPFGAEVQIDDSAPAADRLAAFLGRKV